MDQTGTIDNGKWVPPGGLDESVPVDLAHVASFRIGSLHVEPGLRAFSGPDGRCVVEPKVMQVFVALARKPGAILSREDLLGSCWGGRIVGDNSINRVMSLLRTSLRTCAGNSVSVETLSRVGFRLLVSNPGVEPAEPSTMTREPSGYTRYVRGLFGRIREHRLLVGLLAVCIIGIAGLLIYQRVSASNSRPVSLLIATLEGTSDSDRFFARGLSEELRGELARQPGLRLVSLDGAGLAGTGTSLELGRRLDADYLLTGKTGRNGGRVVLDASLVAVATGAVEWSQRIASSEETSTGLPARLSTAIIEAIGRRAPIGLSARGSDGAVDPATYSLYLAARGMIRTRDPSTLIRARELLEQVTRSSPGFSRGWSGLAKAVRLAQEGMSASDFAAMQDRTKALARRAIELNPENAEAFAVLGLVEPDPKLKMAYLEQAVKLDPFDAEAWYWLGGAQCNAHQTQRCLVTMRKVLALDPLWVRAAVVSEIASSLGDRSLANKIDGDIAAAAEAEWQRETALSRIDLRRGDWSAFIRRTESAARTGPPEQMIGALQDAQVARAFLGLPVKALTSYPRWSVWAAIMSGKAPSRSYLLDHGVSPATFWIAQNVAAIGPRVYLQAGRGDDLLWLYDQAFPNPETLISAARNPKSGVEFFPQFAPDLVIALRQAGRAREASIVLDAAQEMIRPALAAPRIFVEDLVAASHISAVAGDRHSAMALIGRSFARGWPHLSVSVSPEVGRLDADPAYASLRNDQRFRTLAARYETERERERRDVLADDAGRDFEVE